MSWLCKRLGRWWALLTDEDRQLDPAAILAVLLIHQPGEPHLAWALAATRRRFPQALITILMPAEIPPPSDPADARLLEVARLPRRRYGQHLATRLRRARREQLSAVVLLSLRPLVVAQACLWFGCNRLLFNQWGQWFFLRRRTLVEMLTLRRGADTALHAWDGSSPRVRRIQAFLRRASWPVRALWWPVRLLRLLGRVGGTLIVLYGRRGWYHWSHRHDLTSVTADADMVTHRMKPQPANHQQWDAAL